MTDEFSLFTHQLAVLREAAAVRDPEASARCNRMLREQEWLYRNAPQGPLRARLFLNCSYLQEIAEGISRRPPVENYNGGTPEALARPGRIDPLETLLQSGRIRIDEFQAGRSIAMIFEAVCSALIPKIGSPRLEATERINGAARMLTPSLYDRMPESLAREHSYVYLPWTRGMPRETIPLIIDVTVDGLSLRQTAKTRRLRYSSTINRIRHGLADYAKRKRDFRGLERYKEERVT